MVCRVAVVPAEFGFELDRGLVAERRVQALGVVDVLDEDANLAAVYPRQGRKDWFANPL